MSLEALLKANNCSMYRLAKDTGLSYSIINDLCSGKTKMSNCTVGVAYKIARHLHVSLDELVADYFHPTPAADFELFKSNICHQVKDMGDLDFVIAALQEDRIRALYEQKRYPEALYLLAMVDYLSAQCGLPLCAQYADIRRQKLSDPLYPADVNLTADLLQDETARERCRLNAIPEFKRFNIMETDVRNVV